MSTPDYPSYPNTTGTPERVADSNSDLAETAKTDLADLREEVGHQAAALGEEAKAQVGELADKAKSMAGEQKDLLANQLGGVCEALQKVAGELEGSDQTSARYVRMVADGAERITSTIRDNEVDDILTMVQDFGRKQPVAFLGAAALLGFAASRFVAASASRTTQASPAMSQSSDTMAQSDGAPDYAQAAGGSDAGI